MNRVSTHVLDMVHGTPGRGLPVRLEKLSTPGAWQLLNSTRTDDDGRCTQLLPESEDLSAGVYRLIFDTGSYYLAQKVEALYPVVEVTFEVRDGDGESQFHIPLLLSPNGYTTYRGS